MSAKHYLVCGHTAKGYVNLAGTNLEPLNKIYLLMGGPGTGKLDLWKEIASKLEGQDETVEYLHSPSDPEALDGMLFPALGVGIVNAAVPQMTELRAPGAMEEYINLEEAWDINSLTYQKDRILELTKSMQLYYEKAYEEFGEGLRVHDEWEKIYIRAMDFTKANQLTTEVIATLFTDIRFDKPSCVKHRFFGGSTPNGPMDFVTNITADIATRFFIKGRPGSGKSTMLKKLLEAAKARGIDTEVYHCGFDPDSLDMLLFPELSLSIFDSTSPHEYYPCREGDKVIDMYTQLIKEDTDEHYAAELEDIVARYRSHTKAGTAYLAAAKDKMLELEQLYQDATDYEAINLISEELYQRIMESISTL